jgi:hypothetical protein
MNMPQIKKRVEVPKDIIQSSILIYPMEEFYVKVVIERCNLSQNNN